MEAVAVRDLLACIINTFMNYFWVGIFSHISSEMVNSRIQVPKAHQKDFNRRINVLLFPRQLESRHIFEMLCPVSEMEKEPFVFFVFLIPSNTL